MSNHFPVSFEQDISFNEWAIRFLDKNKKDRYFEIDDFFSFCNELNTRSICERKSISLSSTDPEELHAKSIPYATLHEELAQEERNMADQLSFTFPSPRMLFRGFNQNMIRLLQSPSFSPSYRSRVT